MIAGMTRDSNVPMTSSLTPVDPSGSSPDGVGFAGLATAFKRAVVSQCHPRMLLAILLPFLIMLLGALVLIWLFWAPLSLWLTQQADTWTLVNTVDQWLIAVGLFSLKLILVPMLAAVILLPIAGILGVAVAAVFVMPLVLRHVCGRHHPHLQRLGRHATVLSVWNAVWVMAVFALGWAVTLPLWLLPPLGVVLSLFWWTFAFARLMRVDAIVEHASAQERKWILKRHSTGFWTLGFICALLNLLPPAWIVLPVFSALLFAHYGLDAIERQRALSAPV